MDRVLSPDLAKAMEVEHHLLMARIILMRMTLTGRNEVLEDLSLTEKEFLEGIIKLQDSVAGTAEKWRKELRKSRRSR